MKSSADADELRWSEAPSCFERHLQRRCNRRRGQAGDRLQQGLNERDRVVAAEIVRDDVDGAVLAGESERLTRLDELRQRVVDFIAGLKAHGVI